MGFDPATIGTMIKLAGVAEKWAPKLASAANKLLKSKRERDAAYKAELERINGLFTDPVALSHAYVEPKLQQFNPANKREDETGAELRLRAFEHFGKWMAGERERSRRLFVLADAGMGKTSLLVMLKLTHMLGKWARDDLHVHLLKLSDRTLQDIAQIKDRAHTVLLLDSLDEDPTVQGRVPARLQELLDATADFRRVVVTCRTQFFTGGDSPFNRRGQVQVGDALVDVLYLSLFDDAQVDEYLRRRFPKTWKDYLLFRQNRKVGEAAQKLQHMRELRLRPMLLAHVDDVMASDNDWTTYGMVEAMVEAWLLREQGKLRKRLKREVPWQALRDACTLVARRLHETGSRFITPEELAALVPKDETVKDLRHMDVGGRALLNKTSDGAFRFAHKLVQEYLLVRWAGTLPAGTGVRLEATDAMRQLAWESGGSLEAFGVYQVSEGVEFEMVGLPAGEFLMGSPADESQAYDNEKPQHAVRLSSFAIGRVPVTQALYSAVMDEKPSRLNGQSRPVEQVSWGEAVRFCNALSARLGLSPAYDVGDKVPVRMEDADGFRLPTEAEWEYACRAGTTTRYSFGDSATPLVDHAWFKNNSGFETHPVGEKPGNPWGLHDMHGNVWEWCEDWYGECCADVQVDPRGPARGDGRVRRGGSWRSTARSARSASRSGVPSGTRSRLLGFRLARGQPGAEPQAGRSPVAPGGGAPAPAEPAG